MTQSENKEGSTLFGGVTTAVRSQVPPAAKWLGASGVIPFITLAIAVLFLEGADQEAAYFAIAAYGAVILSFLGGIHWGLAVADGDQVAVDAANFIRLGGSVVPSLIGSISTGTWVGQAISASSPVRRSGSASRALE